MPELVAIHAPQPQIRRGFQIRCGKDEYFAYDTEQGVYKDFKSGESGGGVFDLLVYFGLAKNEDDAKKVAADLIQKPPKAISTDQTNRQGQLQKVGEPKDTKPKLPIKPKDGSLISRRPAFDFLWKRENL